MSNRQHVRQQRAARHKVTPAIQPGTLNGVGDHVNPRDMSSPWAKHFMHKIKQACEFQRDRPIPRFQKDTRRMDTWLQGSLDAERTNFLAAFIDQASMIQANRPYRVTGSKTLVNRTLDMLHMSEGGEGFRKLLKLTALNYYTSNLGGAVYLERVNPTQATYLPHLDAWDWQLPPVTQLFATDPTLFAPRDDYIYPYEYDGTPWSRYDFFKVTSMPSTVTPTWGVGRCALYRCIQIARMTSAIYDFIYDTVSPDTAKGIVTIKGLSWTEFLESLTGSEAVNEMDTIRTNGFLPGDDLNDILVFADRDNEISVKFVTLGRIPEGFFLDNWVRWTLTSFATNLGFPLDEFIGTPANRLLGSSANEVDAGERRGGSKGGAEFINQFEENMQQLVIPPTVDFRFAERDASAEQADIAIATQRSAIVTQLFEASQLIELDEALNEIEREARRQSQRIINSAEARRMLVEWSVVPDWLRWDDSEINDWGQAPDPTKTQLQRWRNEALVSPAIQRLAARPMGEPVILYQSQVNQTTGLITESEIVLWEDDSEIARPAAWAGYSPERDGVLRTASMAHNWNMSRNLKKTARLENALKSDHTDAITGLLRRYLVSPASGPDIVPVPDRESQEALTSRMYAITQIGRDSVLGRNRPNERGLAEIAGESVKWAGDYMDAFCHVYSSPAEMTGVYPPTTSTASPKPDGLQCIPIQRLRQEMLDTIALWAGPDEYEAAVAEAARTRSREFAQDLSCRAFAAGQYITANHSSIQGKCKRKSWISNDTPHASMDGAEVELGKDFVEGIHWAGMSAGCRCEVILRGGA